MKNELAHKDYDHLIEDGWVITKDNNENLKKWTIYNKKYSYRKFLYTLSKDSQVAALLFQLNCHMQRGDIKLPYRVLTRFVYSEESKRCVNE